MTNRIGVNSRLIAHEFRDVCCFHLHKEEEALISLKLYGMDTPEDEASQKETTLPSSLDEIDSFIETSTSQSATRTSHHTMRPDSAPYNTVMACELSEETPQRGEVDVAFIMNRSPCCSWVIVGRSASTPPVATFR